MMRHWMMMMVACALMATMSQSAFAGGSGGGSKKDTTIKVKNKSTEVIAVIVTDGSTGNFKDFLNNGGQFLQPGKTGTFKNKAGTLTVAALAYDELGVPQTSTGLPATKQVDVKKGKTVSLNVDFDGTDATFP